MKNPKIVIDTNVFISGILFGGKPRNVIQSVVEGRANLYISTEILDEIEAVLLRPKFKLSKTVVRNILHEIEEISSIVEISNRLKVVKSDKADDKFIECAVAGKANFIVSGDIDLLSIAKYKKIEIISPNEFLSKN